MNSGSDAELLNTIRSGDPGVFAVLRARHEAAARRLAALLTDDPDALVAAAFSQVLEDIARGGGPSDAFRPYLLAALESHYRATGHGPSESPNTEPGLTEPAQGGLAAPVVAAFLALPERWQAVLWHADIERDAPAVIAPLLGLAAADVPALADQARDGLDREYRLLQPAAGDSASARLRRDVAPVYLGAATAAYLADPPAAGAGLLAGLGNRVGLRNLAGLRDRTPPVAVIAASAVVVLAITGVAVYLLTLGPSTRPAAAAGSPGTAASSSSASSSPASSRPAASSSGASSSGRARTTRTTSHQGGPPGQDPGPGSPPPTSPASPPASRPPASPPPSSGPPTTPPPTSSAPPTTAPSTTPPPTTPPPLKSAPPTRTPRPTPTPRPSQPARSAARVTAQVSVSGPGRWGNVAMVVFGVTNSGPAATRPLTASLALPSGAALLTGAQGPPGVPGSISLSAVLDPPGGNGWTCAPVSGGAACTHPALTAAAQSGAQLAIRVSGSSACGQRVEITVTGGTSPAGAQSGGTIQCAQHGPATTRHIRRTRRTRRTKSPGTQRPTPGRRDRGGWPGDPRRHWHWPWPGSPRPGWPPPGWPSPGWPGPAHHWPHHHWPWPG